MSGLMSGKLQNINIKIWKRSSTGDGWDTSGVYKHLTFVATI